MFHGGLLYALSHRFGFVEVWNLGDGQIPIEVTRIECSGPLNKRKAFGLDLYKSRMQMYEVRTHLVELFGAVVLVFRLMGRCKDIDMHRIGFVTRGVAGCKLDWCGKRWVSLRPSLDQARLMGECEWEDRVAFERNCVQ